MKQIKNLKLVCENKEVSQKILYKKEDSMKFFNSAKIGSEIVFKFLSITLIGNMANGIEIGVPNVSAPQGGELVYNLIGEPNSLNPISSMELASHRVFSLTFDTLANYNVNTNEMEPHLAEKWEVLNDGKEYLFYLKKNTKFHDGKPVTAEDVKFSFDVIYDSRFEGAYQRPFYENIQMVEVVNQNTVKFIVKQKYFKNFDQVATLMILPKHIYGDPAKAKRFNRELIGAGPYKLDKFIKGDKIILKKFNNWYGNSENTFKGLYNFDKMVLRFIKDETLSIEMLKKGEIDYTPFRAEAYELKAIGDIWGKSILKVKYQNMEPKSWYFYGWNFKNPLFKSKNARLALTHLMDREAMIKKYFFGYAIPAVAPIWFQNDSAPKGLKPLLYDFKKAQNLLKEDGWEDSDKNGILDKIVDGKKVEFKFTLLHPNKEYEKFHTWFQEDLKKAGIIMEVKFLDWSVFEPLVLESKFDVVAMAWGGGDQDPDPKQLWHSSSNIKGGANFINYSNIEVDKWIDEARAELDRPKRIKLIQKIYEKIAEEAPYTWWFNPTHEFYGVNSKIKRPADALKYRQGHISWWIGP